METTGNNSLIREYRDIIFINGENIDYFAIEIILSTGKMDDAQRKALIDETRKNFSKILIQKPWKKKDEVFHLMATGERVCYFYSFIFAVRQVLGLDLPVIFFNPFGLLDEYLRKGVKSFLKTQKYQQIIFTNPAGFTDKKGKYFVLARRKYSVRVHKV
jgi:hypothetical protein